MRTIISALCLLLIPGFAHAAEYDSYWGGGSGNWTDLSHWSTPAYPNNGTDNYNVFIGDLPANPTVTLNTNITVNRLDNWERLNVKNYSLTLENLLGVNNYSILYMLNGTLNGNVGNTSLLQVDGGGYYYQKTSTVSGALTNDGQVNLTSYGRLNYSGGSIGGAGTVAVPSTNRLNLVNDTDIGNNTINLSGGVFAADNGFSNSGSGKVTGYGTVRGALNGVVVATGNLDFETNSSVGTSGLLRAANGGYVDMKDRTIINNGQVIVENSGRIYLNNSNLNGSGGGSTAVQTGGQLQVDGGGYYQQKTSTVSGALTN
ncbi:MAG: hypothetical protein HZA78_05850, partial [Candidatus Schekmanbacteria bacterium]|nr:hypothetical protein [Candidatus Schekmanbacteria bacterium]